MHNQKNSRADKEKPLNPRSCFTYFPLFKSKSSVNCFFDSIGSQK